MYRLKKIVVVFLIVNLTACSIFSRPKIADTGPQAANTNVQLGLAYLQSGDVQRAKQKLLLAEQQAPQSTESQGAMGYFLESTGNLSEAEAYYRRAATHHSKSGAAQNNYGTFLCRRGRYAEADQHFLLALQDPSYLNVAQVYENAGLCAMQIPDIIKAMGYFTQAITQDPKRALSWLELGRINYQQKNYQQAQQYFDHYMQLTKDPTPNALWLGAVLARALGNENAAGRYTLMLQTRFPSSDAYKALMRTPKLKNKQQKKQLYY
ncbi:MAG: type IV pilus biogenesis/stability protein PilW [Pseudomonadota bacterium]